MATFEYQAINIKGQNVKGSFEADTIKLARQQLKSQDLTLLEIEEVHKKEHSGNRSMLSQRPTRVIMAVCNDSVMGTVQ